MFTFLHILQAFHFRGIGSELMLDYIQIIEQRLHVRSHFLIGITGKESKVFIRQSHDGTCQKNLLVVGKFSQCGSQRQQSLAGSRLTGQGNQLDVRVVQHLKSKALLGITRFNAIIPCLVDPTNRMGKGIITCKHTAAVTLQHKAFVGANDVLKIELVDVQSFFGRINAVYQRRVNTLEHFIRLFEYIHIDYLIIDIVFAQQTDGTRLHAQIHVFRDKDGFHFRLFGRKPVHYRQNLMVGDAFGKGITYPGRVHHACHHKQTAQALSQWRPFGEQIVIGNQI